MPTVSLVNALVTLLNGAADLQAATGRAFSARVAEVWNLPGSVSYPVLAIMPDSTDSVPEQFSTLAEGYTVRMYYVTDGPMLEAAQFRDALRAKLHLQQVSLRASGQLYVQKIKMVGSRVMVLPDVNKHQAYCEFRLVA